jgi:hypothetical protein
LPGTITRGTPPKSSKACACSCCQDSCLMSRNPLGPEPVGEGQDDHEQPYLGLGAGHHVREPGGISRPVHIAFGARLVLEVPCRPQSLGLCR